MMLMRSMVIVLLDSVRKLLGQGGKAGPPARPPGLGRAPRWLGAYARTLFSSRALGSSRQYLWDRIDNSSARYSLSHFQ
ncbi:UNVERIFIED_CONTAM: hypothetical protein Slati_1913900 [Sesamum latifolium]|uniref:Secreted protein n=1 Tax=Sesamum latifolium TaxID=2727402 RepID=A0AAW2X2U1_9LAMI